ncbi:hypothetical protein HHK36_022642 [Tetracentron sinense]|uniref:3-ketoacyl-CoA synthase n=1 Tax=Tetracentron sinense TaxID=13715 RepID=A0A834YQC3_TETSI|nr:hypothetical protein HHK36_022642 [Tetracentron sinense]
MGVFLTLPMETIAAYISTLSVDDLLDQSAIAVLGSTLVVFVATIFFMTRSRKIFLVDFACYKPEANQMCSKEGLIERFTLCGNFSNESLVFQKKVMERSGLGQSTYVPNGLLVEPVNMCMAEARRETQMVMFGAVDELLAKTGLKAKDIGILVVNSSLFNPTPSLSAMIVNRYKLGENVISYNLGGMGCSAGLLSIGLAKQLLQVRANSYALVVSTENIIKNCYLGNESSMLLCNCVFRIGGAAILLSNRRSDRNSSKYQLIDTIHTNTASDDRSYGCIFQEEDGAGYVGVTVSKDLLAVAIDTIRTNITTLGPLVLPITEQLRVVVNLIGRKLLMMKIKPYIPNFKCAFDHFCAHVGGKPVLDGLEKNLGFSERCMEPSRMTLCRFGNTSSSSVWYEVAYLEAKGRIKKGDRMWQIAFGSGFKCSSAVWCAVRTIDPERERNPWTDEIDDFPVHEYTMDEPSDPPPYHFEPSK